MKLKVCGIKYAENAKAVEAVIPDFMGFIFYPKSSRFVTNWCGNSLNKHTKKVGVFVNETFNSIVEKVKIYGLNAVQLHGNETPVFCKQLQLYFKQNVLSVSIIKVFSILNEFDFSELKPFEPVCDFYLFDTKGDLPGGNGSVFNWSVLEQYPSTKPYFLSGGIGLEQLEDLKKFIKSPASKYCYALDVNSKFELEAGLKDANALKQFKNELF